MPSHGDLPQPSPPPELREPNHPKPLPPSLTPHDAVGISNIHKQNRTSTTGAIGDGAEEAILLRPFDNGYHFPPSRSLGESMTKGAISFGRYCLTPVGFFVVLYGLLVVAWGGMLFLLLCNAAPAMCYPTCDDIDSPRRVWVEYDSQIVNALFCVTGFGLAPWRFRDLYYLVGYRFRGRQQSLRHLAGIHRGWFRLPGSRKIPPDIGPGNISALPGNLRDAVPHPEDKIPDAPLTGERAMPTSLWKLDFVIWVFVLNTIFQCCLSGFMWGMNRYNRPSWTVGLFVALGMVAAGAGGIMTLIEGRRIKRIEGVPVSDQDLERLARDKELGIAHYNNIKDKKPKDARRSLRR